MKLYMTTADFVREVTVFALRRKGNCFQNWKPEIVFRYVAFHVLAGTLFLVREGRAILGVGIAYPCESSYLHEHENRPFNWTLPPSGKTLFIAEIVASRKAIPTLLKMALNRWPWISHLMTYRHGMLVELHMHQLDRLARMETV